MKRFRRGWTLAILAALLLGVAAPAQAAQPGGMLGLLSAWFGSIWADQDYEWQLEREASEQAMQAMTENGHLDGEPCPAGDETCGGGGGPMIIPRNPGQVCTPLTPQFCGPQQSND